MVELKAVQEMLEFLQMVTRTLLLIRQVMAQQVVLLREVVVFKEMELLQILKIQD